MILQGNISINGKDYKKGDEISWALVYPFFLIHMLVFGGSGFLMAYGPDPEDAMLGGLYAGGAIALTIYSAFYLVIFGKSRVKTMLINGALSLVGIYAEVRLLLEAFDRNISDYPIYVHVVPFLYYIFYVFLIRQMVFDIFDARRDPKKYAFIDRSFLIATAVLYLWFYTKLYW